MGETQRKIDREVERARHRERERERENDTDTGGKIYI